VEGGTAMGVRSAGELSADEFGQLVGRLSLDSRGNALVLADLLALPELCDVHLLRDGRSWTAAASRRDLPFNALTFSAGGEEEYRALVQSFAGRFGAGDVVYSLIPEPQTSTLARVVEVESTAREIQLFKHLSADLRPPGELESLTAQGFSFRALGQADLANVRGIMKAAGMFAFADASLFRGTYWGAFEGRRLVCTAGTHSLARHAAEIGNVVTLPAYRRRGLARACLSLLLRDLSQHTRSAFLSFFAEIGFLHRLYASLGFREPRPFDLVAWRYPGTAEESKSRGVGNGNRGTACTTDELR
jgi:ribosomal protein S18 acetylase RimI-like enzyme